ncbi:hypothetical protein [Opitutus sp. ER46]|uniref:hypothetical protein n=1 Tax=Opitutus sp. ER46 TaxID=2161864 RepID=UPI000D2F86B3|nr:hypothetical protein [Opitutus sp. ER46]PTX91425.1 hypothetical protein DB354_16165 [Opitutus sp. ER46]
MACFRFPVLVCALLLPGVDGAAEIDGAWRAEFDSAVGIQKYVFELKADGQKLLGRALGERSTDKSETPITDGRLTKNEVYFVERLNYQGVSLRVDYRGTVKGDELVLTRIVGGVFTEQLVAKRLKTKG